ncbi:MAG TPA: hypothetical protein VGN41_04870 [Streptosporangiaceae bacterium]
MTTSTDGPVENAMIRCPAGHWFNGPIEFLAPHARTRAGIDAEKAEKAVSDRSGGRAA